MPASQLDLIKKTGASTVTTLAAPGKATSATSITVGSTTNYPTDTGIVIAIRVVDSAGELVAGTYTEWSATVTSGTTLAINAVPVYGSDQVYAAGSTTQVYIPLSSYAHNKFVDGFIAEHSQLDGTHTDITADSIVVAGNVSADSFTVNGATSDGWSVGLPAQSGTITNNGNRSYDVPFASTVASILTPGMRLRTTRTVTAPTQCADLEASSSQYFNDTSVSGMTFTDDFVVSAWVKLESYTAGSIASRYNGTSGWELRVDATGQIVLSGYNASSANYRNVTTYQSIPLNKWVHIAAQLDMSTHTATTTTSYVMLDGVDVPCSVVQAGTNPTALIQAGDFCVGSRSGGSVFFDGKIAQVAIYSAKVTQATIRTSMSQTLSGSETSLVSAYSFNNSIVDLNANANNLTAQGGALATNADSPFTLDANGVPSGTTDYAIVTKVVTSTATVQVPEGCTIPTSGGVSAVAYSTQKSPYGMPVDVGRWRVVSLLKTSNGTTSNATYGAFIAGGWALVAPIGSWNVGWQGETFATVTTPVYYNISSTALTGLSATAGANASPFGTRIINPAAASFSIHTYITQPQALSSASTYVMYTFGATTGGGIDGSGGVTEIFADLALL